MARSLTIDPDALTVALNEIFDDVDKAVVVAGNDAVKAGASTSAKEWRKGAPVDKGKYKKTIRYKVNKSGGEPEATVYSLEPGLPHLLEKGHARIGGGRTKAIEHVAPAADAGIEKAMQTANEVLDKQLK